MTTCQICAVELPYAGRGRPRIYCDSPTCTRFRQRRRFKKFWYIDKERKTGGSRLNDIAWARLVLRMIQTCKQEQPCPTCTVATFCKGRT